MPKSSIQQLYEKPDKRPMQDRLKTLRSFKALFVKRKGKLNNGKRKSTEGPS